MATRLLLRRGRAAALKAVLLEAQVSRGLASTAPLSAESGKARKGLPPNPKEPSPPKDVVEPKERGQLLATRAAAPLPKSRSLPSSHPAVGSTGVALGGPNPSGNPPRTDEGNLKPQSRKTVVKFPQRAPVPFRVQVSNLKARDDSSSSSSSSSSSASDSESDEEGHDSEVDSRVAGQGEGGLPKPEATYSFESGAPKSSVSTKEKTRVQKSHADITHPEKPQQPRKKGTIAKPLEDKEEAKPKPTTPRSQSRKEVLKQNVKEEQLQEKLRLNAAQAKSPKPFEAKGILLDGTKAGSSAELSDGPPSVLRTEEAREGRRLPATALGAQSQHLEPKVPGWKAAPPLIRDENVEHPEGHSKAKEEVLEDQEAVRYLKTISDQKKGVSDEKTAGPELEASLCEAAVDGAQPVDPAPHQEAQVDTQEPTQAPQPPEPTDNTTYKNLQHHDYNSYTFLDLNLDLSKFRMPQPSSGRESPRH